MSDRIARAAALLGDPIVAVATPRGRGGVGVVRLSGARQRLEPIALRLLGRSLERLDRSLRLCAVGDGERILDRGLVASFVAPRSYTGEHVLELHLHGNPVLLELVMEAAVDAGARLAGPGEFTRRAVLNGRMTLLAAEGVDALVRAPSREAARVAARQLDGAFQGRLQGWRDELLTVAVALEARVDFPEDIDEDAVAELLATLPSVRSTLQDLLGSARAARRLMDGVRVVLTGPTNAGKSTLLNGLLDQDRALVSPVAGTTRDLVSETVEWEGLAFRLEDTAGLRATDDPIEEAGIARSRAALARADLVVEVRDARTLVEGAQVPEGALGVATHGDLADAPAGWLCVDARSEVAEVRAALVAAATEDAAPGEVLLHTARQQQALADAVEALDEAVAVGDDEPVLAASAVRAAGRSLEELLGSWTDEAVLDALFARFCVGK